MMKDENVVRNLVFRINVVLMHLLDPENRSAGPMPGALPYLSRSFGVVRGVLSGAVEVVRGML